MCLNVFLLKLVDRILSEITIQGGVTSTGGHEGS